MSNAIVNDFSSSFLSVNLELESNGEFIALQSLVEMNVDDDLISSESTTGYKSRWEQILKKMSALRSAYADVRLEVFYYRTILALEGVPSAIKSINAFNVQLHSDNQSLESLDQEQMTVCFVALSYFFSTHHIKDLRQSHLGFSHELSNGSLIQLLSQSKDNSGEDNAQNAELRLSSILQRIREQSGLIATIQQLKSLITKLETRLMPFNVFHFDIRSANVVQWLQHLEECLIRNGCPKPLAPVNALESKQALFDVDMQSIKEFSAYDGITPVSNNLFEWQRQDVLLHLERVVEWFHTHEPSNPAPYFIKRAIRLSNADFLSIIQELSPESTPQFEKIAGVQGKK